MGAFTHPVSFYAYVTFEPRKAILTLRKMEVRGYQIVGELEREVVSENTSGRVDFRSWRATWGQV